MTDQTRAAREVERVPAFMCTGIETEYVLASAYDAQTVELNRAKDLMESVQDYVLEVVNSMTASPVNRKKARDLADEIAAFLKGEKNDD